MHGVGASCVNAVSEKLQVEVYRNGVINFVEFRGRSENGLKVGDPVEPIKITGTTDRRGTKVRFWPDKDIFIETNSSGLSFTPEFNRETLAKTFREMTFLNKGLRITFTDLRLAEDDERRLQVYHNP